MKNDFFELIELRIENDLLSTSSVRKLTIFTDISSPVLQLNIVYNDITDIKNRQPLKGGETLHIIIVDKFNNQFTRKFVLKSVLEVQKSGQKDSLLEIRTSSVDSFKLLAQRDYTTYNNSLVSDVVKSINSNIKTTPTVGSVSINNPGWSQLKFINYLTELSSNTLLGGNYLFFDTLDEIVFKPLNELLSVTNINSYIIQDKNEHFRYNILEIEERENFNILENSFNGMYDSTFVMYNPANKSTITNSNKIDDIKLQALGKGKVWNDNVLEYQETRIQPKPFYNINTSKSQVNNQMIFNTYNRKMTILINGDFNVKVGQLININKQNRYEQSNIDSEGGGIWLIDKMSYNLNIDSFVMKLELIRNATYDYKNRNKNIINPTIS